VKLESVVYAVSGIFFGLIAGWIIGSQQAAMSSRPPTAPPAAQSAPPSAPSGSVPGTPPPAILDESKVQALRTVADKDSTNAVARAQLGNLYYDAGRYTDAIKWYADSLAINPKDVDVSTDLGVSYYYNNQTDHALAQLEKSLSLNPSHTKTLLNIGVVRAFGKQDLKGASDAWKRLVEIAPESPEGQAAKQALASIATSHPNLGQ
jgi:tetratricopeptide (TPR) repeat protein